MESENIFIVPFLNLFFFLGMVPFKIFRDKEKDQYYLKSFRIHKVVCGLFHVVIIILITYGSVYSCCMPPRRDMEPTIVLALEFVSNFANLFSVVLVMRFLWRRQDLVLEVIENTRIKTPKYRTLWRYSGSCILILIELMMCVTHWWMIANHDHDQFGVINNGSKIQNDSETILCDNIDGSCSPLWVNIVITYASTFYLCVQGIFIVTVVTLAFLATEFQTKLAILNFKENHIGQGVRLYRELKRKTDSIRKLLGAHLFAYYITSVAFYAEAPHVILGKRGNTEKIILAYFIVSGVIWILAAEFHQKVRNAVLRWLKAFTDKEQLDASSRLRLLAVSNEISIDPVALHSKCFAVTYSHIGTMVGLIVTYGIIVFQLYDKKELGTNQGCTCIGQDDFAV